MGNVGILSSPSTRLDIKSDEYAVFDKNYTLLPLEQVETHTLQNGHLHNTPSADDLNDTVKLGEATVNQQEKIEEIYLHLIEMNKEIKALKAENERLKQEIDNLK